MNIVRVISFMIFIIFSVGVTSAVQVVDSSNTNTDTSGVTYLLVTIFVTGIAILIVIVVLILVAMMLFKWYSNFVDNYKGNKDFLYHDSLNEIDQCHKLKDDSMKYRNWKTLFLSWKRHIVYIDDGQELKPIGTYNGETNKKQDLFIMSIYNKMGIFQYSQSLILIPYKFKKDIVRKVDTNGVKSLIIKCHGIDRLGTMPYLYKVLIKSNDENKEFLDYTNLIHKTYFENIVLTNIIKDDLVNTREMIKKATDINPYISTNRKKE